MSSNRNFGPSIPSKSAFLRQQSGPKHIYVPQHLKAIIPIDMLALPLQMTTPSTGTGSNVALPNKRPKLSLQTSFLPKVIGRSSTALTLAGNATEAANTPTSLNTFSNAYSLPHRPSPKSATPRSTHWPSQPYHVKLPLGVKPILRNSRIASLSYATSSASPRSGRRIFFPPTKRVCFRSGSDLFEIVQTKIYVAAHSDLTDSEDSYESDDETQRKQDEAQSQRQVRAEALREQKSFNRLNSISKSRRKKRRWEWTLSPFDAAEISSLGTEGANQSEVITAAPQVAEMDKPTIQDDSAIGCEVSQ